MVNLFQKRLLKILSAFIIFSIVSVNLPTLQVFGSIFNPFCCLCTDDAWVDAETVLVCTNRCAVEGHGAWVVGKVYRLHPNLSCGMPCSNENSTCFFEDQELCDETFKDEWNTCSKQSGVFFTCNPTHDPWVPCLDWEICSCDNWEATPQDSSNCECVDCLTDDDCDEDPNKPKCDTNTNRCVECLTNPDCPTDKPNCNNHVCEPDTLINLTSFTAAAHDGHVVIEWETATEIDNAGFHLWRNETQELEYKRITEELIPAEGTETQGTKYSFTDSNVFPGQTYYYKLEDIDYNGVSTLHGPISVTVGEKANALISPKDGAVLPAVFEWKIQGFDKFKLEFSTDSDFSAINVTLPKEEWITDNFYIINKDEWESIKLVGQNGETIYWRVYWEDEEDKSFTSEVNSFTIFKINYHSIKPLDF